MAEFDGLHEDRLPIFHQDWWLDSVAPGQWGKVSVEIGGVERAMMPFVAKLHRLGEFDCIQPPLTPWLGPVISNLPGKLASRLGKEIDLVEELLDKLPEFARFDVMCSPDLVNCMPFILRGFRCSVYYTYRIGLGMGLEEVWNGFLQKIRTDIRKAAKSLRIETGFGANDVFECYEKSMKRQGMGTGSIDRSLVDRIESACQRREAYRTYVAVDECNRKHAGAVIVYDSETAYYLLGGGDPDLRSSGAHSLVLWQAIQDAFERVKVFDFEGSVVPSIERFFRGFGGRLTSYYRVQSG